MRETPHISRGHESISEELYQTTGNPNDIDSMVKRFKVQLRMDSAENTPEARANSQRSWNKLVQAMNALRKQDTNKYEQAVSPHRDYLKKIQHMMSGKTGATSPGSAAPPKAAEPQAAKGFVPDTEWWQNQQYQKGVPLNKTPDFKGFKHWVSAAK